MRATALSDTLIFISQKCLVMAATVKAGIEAHSTKKKCSMCSKCNTYTSIVQDNISGSTSFNLRSCVQLLHV